MKLLTYTGSIITALAMAYFQIAPDPSPRNWLLIGVFNLGGVLLFILAGLMNGRKKDSSVYIFIGAIGVRLYTFNHIVQVFNNADMWSMIMCNTVLIVFEIALYFVQDSNTEIVQAEHQDYQAELNAIIAHCETLGVYNRANEPVLSLVKRALSERPEPVQKPVKVVRKKRTGKRSSAKDKIERVYTPDLSVREVAKLAKVSPASVQNYKQKLNGRTGSLNPPV